MRISKAFLIGLIILAGIFSYFNTLSAGFVWDDSFLVVQNPYIKSLRFLPDFFTHDICKIGGSATNTGYYRPLFAASFMADYALWKDNPFGFHLTNLILHIFICILIFIFLNISIRKRFVAFISSLFFAVHPIHTESVSFISGRVDLLPFFFILVSLIFYLLDRDKSKPAYYLVSCGCFFLALLNKEMAVTLPLILVSLDYFFISKEGWLGVKKGFFRRYSGFFIAFVLYLGLRSFFLDSSFILSKAGYSNFVSGSGHFWRFFTVAKIFAMYLRLLVFPDLQSASYFFKPANSLFEPLVLAGAGSAMLLIWLVFKNARKNPEISFAFSWLLITVLPVSNLIPQGNIFAERYMYIPSLGFCLSAGLFFGWLLSISEKVDLLKWRKFIYLFLAVYIVSSARDCYERNKVWEYNLVLWFETAKVSPDNALAHANLASSYCGVGALDKALNEIQISLKLSPNSYYSLLILGKIFQKQENLDQAIKVFKLATIRYPDLAEAYNYWAEVLGQKGLYQEAIRLCHTALKINPYFDSAMFTLGLNYSLAGEFDQAIEEFKQYLLINPSSAEAQAEIEKARFKSKAR